MSKADPNRVYGQAEVDRIERSAFARGRQAFPHQHWQSCDLCDTTILVGRAGDKIEPYDWADPGMECPVCEGSLGSKNWNYDGAAS